MRRVDRPDELPVGAGLLHVGPPKTGTSALQAAFDAAREPLAERGVTYVSRSLNPLGVARFAAGWHGGADAESYRRRWERLSTQFRTSSVRHPVLSSEGFAGAPPARIAEIIDALGGDVHVLVTARSLASLLGSIWQQVTREGNVLGFEEWLRTVLPEDPAQQALPGFDAGDLLATWGQVVGEERMIFLCSDPADRTANLRAVEHLLGVPELLELQPTQNASPPFGEVEMMRHVHIARGEQDAEAWRKVMRKAGRRLGDHPPDGVGSQRIRPPRWAVETANLHAERTRAAIEASNALVVGDPAHLVVDPSAYPEALDVPRHVSVASAGWYADVLARTAVTELVPTPRTAPKAPAEGEAPSVDRASIGQLVRELGARPLRRAGRAGRKGPG